MSSIKKFNNSLKFFSFFSLISIVTFAQGTRLLRQPTISNTHIAYAYGGDLWVSDLSGNNTLRLTSTSAVESEPHFSPDGQHIAFTSNRSGSNAVYTVSVNGGEVNRLTWHPSAALVRGWTPDGKHILYASSRHSAPTRFNRLWTVSKDGGPSTLLNKQWGARGSYSPNGKQIAIDRISRWDSEWQEYRGGQNTPLIILDLKTNEEILLPNDKTTDIDPLWMGNLVYFLSDRDFTSNIWSFNPATKALKQITTFTGSDIKSISGNGSLIAYERDGYLHTLNPATGNTTQLNINVVGDFSWAETKWEDVGRRSRSASLSPNAKRAIVEARGEIFTIPIENGNARNMTQSSDVADRAPIWSPKGDEVAWFSDKGGKGYALMIANQDGLSKPRSISIGESKLGWEPTWSPDGKYIAFVDDDVRIRIIDMEAKSIKTVDTGGNNLERGRMGLQWSKDSQWLAYAKSGSNSFRQIYVWSLKENKATPITNSFADSFSPSWDTNGRYLYFLASTDLALGSGWANTSAITSNANYATYIVNLRQDDPSTFKPKSDEEDVKKEDKDDDNKDAEKEDKEDKGVTIDFDGIERRTQALPMPTRNYTSTYKGAEGTVFIAERIANTPGLTLHKYSVEKGKAEAFTKNASQISISTNGKHLLARIGSSWKVVKTSGANAKSGKSLKVDLKMKLNRAEEWQQMFEEAWRYERDYFYDPNLHGRDWNKVYKRYAPLVPFIKHRDDLNYILDQMNGELSVGHSFVRGGDFPSVDRSTTGLLGADLKADKNRWKITRIFTTESWNPGLSSPLDRPELNIKEGYYLVGVNGQELTAGDDPYQLLDGTAGEQTVLHINDTPNFKDSWKEIIEPIRSENALRQRAWVEDNRRMVDQLSNGKLAYIWVPNTSGPGFVSFNRYYFAQQDKQGAVIDERFNGGGLLDDYMVDLMTRSLRAGLTNEVPGGEANPMRLPAGILGPKALLINELAGSGGDFFPWVFRQQNAGPLIGATTWGGLVKSSTHYALIDGGSLTAPDNAVFDPINNKWIAENEGVAPDIAVRQDAKALNKDKDPQLERAVQEVLRMLEQQGEIKVRPPSYSTPAIKKN